MTSPDLGDDASEDEDTQPSIRLASIRPCSCEEALALRARLQLIHQLTEWFGSDQGARLRLEHIARLAQLSDPETTTGDGDWVLSTLQAAADNGKRDTQP